MAKQLDSLFELVQNMSKSEKRYFKLTASLHTGGKENNALKLFSYLDQVDEYDEDKLRKYFKGEAFLNKLSISKKRLYDNLLNTLNAYHQNNSPSAQLYGLLQSAELLFEKGLYRQSEKTLSKAEKWAEKYELITGNLEIQRMRRKLLEQSTYLQVEEKTMDALDATTKRYLQMLQEESELWILKSRVLKQLMMKGKFDQDETQRIYQLIEQKSKVVEGPLGTLESQYLKNHLESAFHFGQQNLTDSLECLRRNYDLFKQNPAFLNGHKERFIATLSNSIYAADRLNMDKQVQLWLNELRLWHKKLDSENSNDLQARSFTSVFSVEVSFLAKRGQFEEACAKEEEVLSGLERYKRHISPARKAFFHFKLAESFLAINEPSRALHYLREILNDTELDDKEDIVHGAHLLQLLVHLDLENVDTLPYLIKTTKRYLKKRNRYGDFENLFLSTMLSFKSARNVFEREEIWSKYLQKRREMQAEKNLPQPPYFDFDLWASAKIKGVSYQEIYIQSLDKHLVAV